MLGLTECTLTYTWWILKWAVQRGGEHAGAAQVWVVLQFAVLRLGVSPDQWLFTTLFLEMEKRWRFYFTAVISAWLGVVLCDTSSSSLRLIWRGMLMASACSVSGAFVFTASLGGTAASQRVQDVLSPWRQFFKRFSLLPLFSSWTFQHWLLCQGLITLVVFLSRLQINELPVSGRKCRLKVAQSISWRGGQPRRKWADRRNLIPQKCIEYESQEADRLL